jgi:hypothetical protein
MTSLTILRGFGLGGVEAGIIGILVIFVLGVFVANIFYLLTLQRTLELVSPDLRKMTPGLVWLMFIPLFSIVWNFIMVGHIGDSLRDEFRRRNIPVDEERPGYSVGLWMCILPLTGWVPVIGIIGSIGSLVCWIIYWTKIKRYKEMLENSSPFQQFQQNPYGQQYQQQQNPYGQQNPNQPNPYQQNPYQQNPNQQNPYQPNPNQQNPYQDPQNPQTPPNPFENPGNTPPPYNG